MSFTHACRVFAIVSALIFVIGGGVANAQGPAPPATAANSTTVGKSASDFSLSIDPTSVKNFSDEQLNETFDKMSAQYSRNAVLFNNIGATYFERKMYDKAEAALKRAIILNNHPAFLTNLSVVYDTQKRLPEAISAAQRAVTQSPRYARARIQLCELMVVSSRNSDAIICYDELAKFAPLDAMSQSLYAMMYVKLKNYDRAISMVSPLMRSGQPTPLMLNVLGYSYYQKKRYNQAVEIYKQAVELDPDSSNLRYNLAMALTATNNPIGALSQYNLVKEKDPKMADQLYRYLYRDKIIYVDDMNASKKP
jgi:tetratricopeptide (TPR) repeat protein